MTGHSRRLSARHWAIGASAGAIFLFAALAVGRRAARHEVNAYLERTERERAIGEATTVIAPGAAASEEIHYAAAEGYSFVVHPYDGPCSVAFGPLGTEGVAGLKREALRVGKGETRNLDGSTKTGAHAWAVWNDSASPVRAFIRFQDTRKR